MYTTGAAVLPRAGARRAAPNKNSRGTCKNRPNPVGARSRGQLQSRSAGDMGKLSLRAWGV